MGALSNIRDGLINVLSGRGTSIDRAQHSFWHFMPMPAQQIEAAYRGSWLISKIVDLPAMDMVREWREWEAEPKDVKRIEAEERRLRAVEVILSGLIFGRLGGGIVIIGSGTDMAAPARPSDKVLYLKALPRLLVTLGPIDWDVTSDNFGEPEYFEINGKAARDRIHPSRVIVFKGERVPGLIGTLGDQQFWGDSVIDRVDQAVKNANTVGDGFASLVDEAKLDIYKFSGMADRLLQPGGEEKMRQRFEATALGKSNWRGIYLDKEDEWETRQITWAGMPEMIRTYLAIVAGAADIPATRLLGKAPDGQNATGEHDEKNYMASIRTRQNMVLRPALEKLDTMLLGSLGIAADTPWIFSPLDAPSEMEAADIAKKKAETVQIHANSGLVPEEALAKGVQSQLIEDGTYPGLKEALDEIPEEERYGNPDDLLTEEERRAKGGDRASAGGGVDDPARRAANDAKPIPLYVQRKLLNAADLIAWAKAQGFKSTLPADDMHVTVLYSRTPVDPIKMGEAWGSEEDGNLVVKAGGPRAIERLGENAVVLLFASWSLASRHDDMVRNGASHDYDEYQPHVTISYEALADLDIGAIKPFAGELRFGPEIFEPLDLDWKSKVTEDGGSRTSDHPFEDYSPRQPRGRDGRWISVGGGARAAIDRLVAGQGRQVLIGEVSASTAQLISRTGLDARDKPIALDPSWSRHIINNHGGASEKLRGQIPVTKTDLLRGHQLINRSRSITAGTKGQNRFVATTISGRSTYTIVGEVRKRRVVIVSMWKK